MAVETSRQTLDLAALGRAFEQQLRVERIGLRTWRVQSHSRSGHWWTQYLHPDSTVDCDCPAGQNGYACKHAAAVLFIARSNAVPVPPCEHDWFGGVAFRTCVLCGASEPTERRSDSAPLAHERRIGKYFRSDEELEF